MTATSDRSRVDRTSPWPLVLCLVGLDYFSTLAYLPSIAVEAAGPLAPLAVGLMVVVTFALALPVYWYVVGRSPGGYGATELVEHTCPGWRGKILVLILLGFAAADFVITRSLSVADAATHLIHNPHGQSLLVHFHALRAALAERCGSAWVAGWLSLVTPQMAVTLLLSLLTFVLWWPLRRGITGRMLLLAAGAMLLYLFLAGLVVFGGLAYILSHPPVWKAWLQELLVAVSKSPDERSLAAVAGKWLGMALWCFPQIALGLSGFELVMTVAPNVRGAGATDAARLAARIHNTRKLMLTAASVMAVYLLSAVIVTTVLLPPQTLAPTGAARHRALSYIAHGGALKDGVTASDLHAWLGGPFGDAYDLAAIAVLCLAGASVMMGLRRLVPHYLHRLGMELSWAGRVSVILHVLNVVILVVTLVFHASLSAQQWAYATSVLVLLGGAALGATWDVSQRLRGSRWRRLAAVPFALSCGFFLGMTGLTLLLNRSGLFIALAFVASILVTSFFSRWLRSTELRFEGFAFADEASRARWEEICRLPAKILVPHRPGLVPLSKKDAALRSDFHLNPATPVIFVEAHLGDPSDFFQAPLMKVETEGELTVIRLEQCVSVSHVLAAVCVEVCRVGPPPEMIFGWSPEAPLAANLNFLLLGQGNVPWMVKEMVRRAIPDETRQPRILIG